MIRRKALPFPAPARTRQQGIVLLTTMVLLLMVASVIALTQARARAGTVLFARLERAERDGLAELEVRERLRPLLAEALTTPPGTAPRLPLDGTAYEMMGDGFRAEVRALDVKGLVDIYLAPPERLAKLPSAAKLVAGRAAVLPRLAPGERFTVTEATLAAFGLGRGEREALVGLVGQWDMMVRAEVSVRVRRQKDL